MYSVYPYVSDAEDRSGGKQKGIRAVKRDQKYRDNRKGRSGNRDPKKRTVKIDHFFIAPEIAEPVKLVEQHQNESEDKQGKTG